MRYIVLDGYSHGGGTGVRDINSQEWVNISELLVSDQLKNSIKIWGDKYHEYSIHEKNHENTEILKRLDEEGIRLSLTIMQENKEYKIDYYYSDVLGKREYLKLDH